MAYDSSTLTLHPDGYWYGNALLDSEKQKENAVFIRDRLIDAGWTKNAIAGFLGNAEAESTLNPGVWQSGNVDNRKGGYGLTQWTPCGTKYLDWCDVNALIPHEMSSALARVNYELENGLQWVKRSTFNSMTFKQFSESNEPPAYLARVFVACYEIPLTWLNGGADRENTYKSRANKAEKWYEYCFGESAPPYTPDVVITNSSTMSKLLLYAVGSDLI